MYVYNQVKDVKFLLNNPDFCGKISKHVLLIDDLKENINVNSKKNVYPIRPWTHKNKKDKELLKLYKLINKKHKTRNKIRNKIRNKNKTQKGGIDATTMVASVGAALALGYYIRSKTKKNEEPNKNGKINVNNFDNAQILPEHTPLLTRFQTSTGQQSAPFSNFLKLSQEKQEEKPQEKPQEK